MSDQPDRVAITGASGLVGGRLVEVLTLESTLRVRALVRHFGRLARLSPLPQERLEFRAADIDDPASLPDALSGCRVVVHCAFGNRGSVEERYHTTVEGTAAVVAAARRVGAERLVHLSTIEVYDVSGLRTLDESAPLLPDNPADREYERQKVAAEQVVLGAGGDLEVVVLQPGVVYGPWADGWTTGVLERLPADSAALPTGDYGHCHAVYVDDLVHAIQLALWAPGAVGERLIIRGAEQVSWGSFFDAYRGMLGLPRPSRGELERLPEWEQELYRREAVATGERARDRLGFRGATPLRQGMHRVEQWARWMGYVTAPGS